MDARLDLVFNNIYLLKVESILWVFYDEGHSFSFIFFVKQINYGCCSSINKYLFLIDLTVHGRACMRERIYNTYVALRKPFSCLFSLTVLC